MNEDVSPIEHGDFSNAILLYWRLNHPSHLTSNIVDSPASHVSFRGGI